MEAKDIVPNLPEALTALLGHAGILGALGPEDLREMSKFGERANVHGLPLHDLSRPPDRDGLLESSGAAVDLPTSVYIQIREALRAQPQILLRGAFAGEMRHRFAVAALFPQDHAGMAQVWNALMWRGPQFEEQTPALTVLHLPDFPQPILLSLPDEGLALILGTDDPRPGLFVALEWANRHWNARNELIRLRQLQEGNEPSVMLPGGSFLFEPGVRANGDDHPPTQALVFPGESVPVSWESTLRETLPTLAACDEADLLLAGAEPWCAEGGGRTSPFWRNPFLPVSLLRHSPPWRAAALHPDGFPMGLSLDAAGRIDWAASQDDAFVVVPRAASPPPFVASLGPFLPSTHYTHRAMKPEAMKLWAMGFPAPEVLGPGGGH